METRRVQHCGQCKSAQLLRDRRFAPILARMADRLPVEAMLDDYLARWKLTPDGDPIVTRTSAILPVRSAGLPAVLKIATVEEERRGPG